MSYLKAPLSEHGSVLPIPALDFGKGQHTMVDSLAVSVPVDAGVYQITANVGILISQSGEAYHGSGSAYVAAGVPVHLLLEAGDLSIRAEGDDEVGHAFIVPLKAV